MPLDKAVIQNALTQNIKSTQTQGAQKAKPTRRRRVSLGLSIRRALHQHRQRRQALSNIEGVSVMHQAVRFDRAFWLSTQLHQRLKMLLEEQLLDDANPPCGPQGCSMQARANRVFTTSYRFLMAVLQRLTSPQPTALAIKQAHCDRFGVRRRTQSPNLRCELHTNELADLVEIINERIVEALYDEQANYPDPNDRVDDLPVVAYTLDHQGHTGLNKQLAAQLTEPYTNARYWSDRYAFYLPILALYSDGDTATLRDRHSLLPWYCGTCLSHHLEALSDRDNENKSENKSDNDSDNPNAAEDPSQTASLDHRA